MKKFIGVLIITALFFVSCNTTYYSSTPYEDDIYYSSSNSRAELKVTQVNSSGLKSVYNDNQEIDSKKYPSIYLDKEKNNIDKLETNVIVKEYVDQDTIYIDENSEVYGDLEYEYNDYGMDYATRIYTFHRPYCGFSYYRFRNPFYYYWDYSYYYDYYWGYPYYYDYYWNYGWFFNYELYWGWHWPYHHNHYYWSWGYPYNWHHNTSIGHHYSDNNSYYYGPRNKRGRNSYSLNQMSRTGTSLSSGPLRKHIGNTSLDAESRSKPIRGTTLMKEESNYQKNPNTNKSIFKERNGIIDKESIYSKPGSDPINRSKTIIKYRKPTTYISPLNRNTGTSRSMEFQVPQTNQRKTVDTHNNTNRVIINSNKTKSYSTPSRNNVKSYTVPARSGSKQNSNFSRSSSSKTYSKPINSGKSVSHSSGKQSSGNSRSSKKR